MEVEVGVVEHYFGKIQVAAIRILNGTLKVGEKIRIKGATTDFTQGITSMQIEHNSVEEAKEGDVIGVKVIDRVREGDRVYKIIEE